MRGKNSGTKKKQKLQMFGFRLGLSVEDMGVR